MSYDVKAFMIKNNNYKDINPLCAGWQECTPGHFFGPTSRTYYLLHYVACGRGVFENRKGRFDVSQGQIFVIKPDEITFYQADASEPWTYYWIGFECNIQMPSILQQSVINSQNCEHIFTSLRSFSALEYGKENLLCSKIYELFSILDKNSTNTENQPLDYILRAKNYIESNYVNDIKIEQIAKYLNIDRSYFTNIFKKHIGVSPQEYLVDYRLNKAAQLISVYGYKPSGVCFAVGYKDAVNFSRMFKRRFGVSPSHYAKGTVRKNG